MSVSSTADHEIEQILRAYAERIRIEFESAPGGLLEEHLPDLNAHGLTPEEVAELGEGLPVPLPGSFQEYLLGPAITRGPEWEDISILGNQAVGELANLLTLDELWPLRLLQFAYGPCGDPVCFDFAGATGGELPVVIINHDWAHDEDWQDAERIRKFTSIRWPDFRSFLRDICEQKELDFRDFSAKA